MAKAKKGLTGECCYQGCGKMAKPFLHDESSRPSVAWYCPKHRRHWESIIRKVSRCSTLSLRELLSSQDLEIAKQSEAAWRKQADEAHKRSERKKARQDAAKIAKGLRASINAMLSHGHSIEEVKVIVVECDIARIMGE